MTTTIDAPEIVARGRTLKAEWPVGETYHDDDERGQVQQLAVLTIHYYGRAEYYGQPEYCYMATLDRQQAIEHEGGFKVRKQTIGITERTAVRMGRADESQGGELQINARRYSAKRAREFLDLMVENVRASIDDGDPDVCAIFGADS